MHRKRKLFELFRRRLEACDIPTTSKESLICPLCWTEARYVDLSLEHVIPESLGGRHLTLSCIRCNNRLGTEIDAHLSNCHNASDALHGVGMVPATVFVNGARMAIDFQGPPWNMRVVAKASDPRDIARSEDEFKHNKVEELQVSLRLGYNPHRTRLALLKIAYLGLFHRLGYDYARTRAVQVLRRRISNPSIVTPDLTCLVARIETSPLDLESSWCAIPIRVADIPIIAVIIRCARNTTMHHSVFMPALATADYPFFEVLHRFYEENKRFNITFQPGTVLHL